MPKDRWGPEGPPAEAYERVSDPERFRGLHAAGREVLDDLEARYRVRRETFLDTGRPYGAEPGEILRPGTANEASFGLTYTEAPGVQMWVGGRRHGHFPMCACDACDLTLDDCVPELRDWAQTVADGSFGETLSIRGDRWWHTGWYSQRGAGRGSSEHPVDDAEAERLLERMPGGEVTWLAWSVRPSGDGAAGRSVGTVRWWWDAEGWGVIDSPDTPGGCWTHYSHLDVPGFRTLRRGQTVTVDWEPRGQDGCPYRAVRVVPEG